MAIIPGATTDSRCHVVTDTPPSYVIKSMHTPSALADTACKHDRMETCEICGNPKCKDCNVTCSCGHGRL